MQLLNYKIESLAKEQYKYGSNLEKQNVVAKFFNPVGNWDWYLMNMEDENYAWGIVDGEYVEMGSFSIKELQDIELPFGLGIERDLLFRPTNAKKLWDKLKTKNNM